MWYFLCVKGLRPFAKIWRKCNVKWPKPTGQNANYSGFTNQNAPKEAPKVPKDSAKKDADYIDFEEVK